MQLAINCIIILIIHFYFPLLAGCNMTQSNLLFVLDTICFSTQYMYRTGDFQRGGSSSNNLYSGLRADCGLERHEIIVVFIRIQIHAFFYKKTVSL